MSIPLKASKFTFQRNRLATFIQTRDLANNISGYPHLSIMRYRTYRHYTMGIRKFESATEDSSNLVIIIGVVILLLAVKR